MAALRQPTSTFYSAVEDPSPRDCPPSVRGPLKKKKTMRTIGAIVPPRSRGLHFPLKMTRSTRSAPNQTTQATQNPHWTEIFGRELNGRPTPSIHPETLPTQRPVNPLAATKAQLPGNALFLLKQRGVTGKTENQTKYQEKKITWITNKKIIIPNKTNHKSKKKKNPPRKQKQKQKNKKLFKGSKKEFKKSPEKLFKTSKKLFRSSERRSPSAVRPSCPRRSQAAARPSLPLHRPYPEGSEEPPEPPNMPSL